MKYWMIRRSDNIFHNGKPHKLCDVSRPSNVPMYFASLTEAIEELGRRGSAGDDVDINITCSYEEL